MSRHWRFVSIVCGLNTCLQGIDLLAQFAFGRSIGQPLPLGQVTSNSRIISRTSSQNAIVDYIFGSRARYML